MNSGDQLTELRDSVSAATGRNVRRIVNGLRLAAGLDRPGVGCTPRTVAWSSGRARLMHYTAGADAGRPAGLLVARPIKPSYIWGLWHGDSFVERLLSPRHEVR